MKTVGLQAVDDRLPGLAAEVSFWGVFSLFPALLIAAGLLGALDSLVGSDLAAQAEAQVLAALDSLLTAQGAGVVDSVRGLFHQNPGGVLTTAALVAVWSASSAFSTVVDALDIVYEARHRNYVLHRLLAIGLALGSVVVLVLTLVMLLVGPLFGGGRALANVLGAGDTWAWVWTWLRAPVAVVLLALWATTLFRLAPHRRSRWKQHLPGGITTALLAVGASYGFQLYVSMARGGNPVLGVLGGGLLLLLWLYLLAFVLLLGGEVNAVLAKRVHLRAERVHPAPGHHPGQASAT